MSAERIQLQFAVSAVADIERLEVFLQEGTDPLSGGLWSFLWEALVVLEKQPGVGRPVLRLYRELVVERGRSGYLVRYLYQRDLGQVTILRIRHQRESGYTEDEI